jgi:hypothetical protein
VVCAERGEWGPSAALTCVWKDCVHACAPGKVRVLAAPEFLRWWALRTSLRLPLAGALVHLPARPHTPLQVPKLGRFPGPNSVVVMDNCAIHHKHSIYAWCGSVGAIAVFLPPYSPQFNPIEKMFGCIKTFFRANRDILATMPAAAAIQYAFASITPSNCAAWIHATDCYVKHGL